MNLKGKWIIVLVACLLYQGGHGEETTKILFIGNSYTGQIRGVVEKLFAASPRAATTELAFITPGGKTLAYHLSTASTRKKIENGNWDFVVLQDQSQTPAGRPKSFHTAADGLDKLIDASGAKTVFYQTWGRRDGDKANIHLFPDYESMQKALSKNYSAAAKRCDALLAPVGDSWRQVRLADAQLGTELYKKDGSHPSSKGAYLAACVFYATIFNETPPADIKFKGGLTNAELKVIMEAVKQKRYPLIHTLTNSSGVKIEVQITGRSSDKLYFDSKGSNHILEIKALPAKDRVFIEGLPITK